MDVVDANIGRLALFNTPLVFSLQFLLINFIQQNSFFNSLICLLCITYTREIQTAENQFCDLKQNVKTLLYVTICFFLQTLL